MVGDNNVQRLHPDDIATILEALHRTSPPAQSPLVAAISGADVGVMRQFVAEEVERKLDRNLARFEMGIAEIKRDISKFVPDDKVTERIEDAFERIGLRVDDDHYEATGEAVRGFMKWHKYTNKVVGGMVVSALGAIVIALLKMVGINIPATGGN